MRKKVFCLLCAIFMLSVSVNAELFYGTGENEISKDYVLSVSYDEIFNSQTFPIEVMNNAMMSAPNSLLTCNIGIYYDNVLAEKTLLANKSFESRINISNISGEDVNCSFVIAYFDKFGKMIVSTYTNEMALSGSLNEFSVTSSIIDTSQVSMAKIFAWRKDTMTPLCSATALYAGLSSNRIDGKKMLIDVPTEVKILNESGIGWVIISPKRDGMYEFEENENCDFSIYDSEENLCTGELTYPNKYYVKIQKRSELSSFNIKLCSPQSTHNDKMFKASIGIDEYYSSAADCGKLYMNNALVSDLENLFPVSYLVARNQALYFNCNKTLYKLFNGDISVVFVADARNMRLIDGNIVFNNWSDSGTLYKCDESDICTKEE